MKNENKNSKALSHKDTHTVAFWKIIEYTGLILFLAVLPRSMGAEAYGDFAVVLSLLGLFLLISALGGMATFGRFVPRYYADDRPELVDGLFTQFFLFRLLLSLPLTVLFPVLLAQLRPEIGLDVAVAAALAYFFGTISMACFQLFFGLNRIGLWLFHDSSSRLLLVILLAVYWQVFDLKNAVYSMAIIEFVLAAFAIFWSRNYFSLRDCRKQLPDFMGHLKFGIAFFAANLLLMIIWRSGEIIIVTFTNEAEQVAFYNLANSIFLALNALFAQIGSILIPSVSAMHSLGEHERKDQWLALMLKYITAATLLTLLAIHAVGEPVLALLLGDGFSEATANLYLIAISLVPLALVRLGFTTAVVHDQLKGTFYMSGLALVSFFISATVLTPEYGAKGVSVSVTISSFVAATFAYWYFRLSPVTKLASFGKVVIIGAVLVALVMFSGYPSIMSGISAFVFFCVILLMLRIVRFSELLNLVIGNKGKT